MLCSRPPSWATNTRRIACSEAISAACFPTRCTPQWSRVRGGHRTPLLRDAQVLPIWEGTTNVLALDLLRTVIGNGGIESVENEFERCSRAVDAPRLQCAVQTALDAFQTAAEWLRTAQAEGSEVLQAGARLLRVRSGTPWSSLTRPATPSGHWSMNRTGGPLLRPNAWPRSRSITSRRAMGRALTPWPESRPARRCSNDTTHRNSDPAQTRRTGNGYEDRSPLSWSLLTLPTLPRPRAPTPPWNRRSSLISWDCH